MAERCQCDVVGSLYLQYTLSTPFEIKEIVMWSQSSAMSEQERRRWIRKKNKDKSLIFSDKILMNDNSRFYYPPKLIG